MKVGGIAIVLVILVVVIMMFGSMTDGVKDARTTAVNNSFVVTTGDTTAANVTLVQALWESRTSDVTVTSNVTAESPLPNTYTAATKKLEITGLTANTTRTLTVNYLVDALADHSGTDDLLKFTPLLFGFALVAILIGIGVKAFGR